MALGMETLPQLTPAEFNQVATAIITFLGVCGAFKLLRRAF